MRHLPAVFVLLALTGLVSDSANGQSSGPLIGWGDRVLVDQVALRDIASAAGGEWHSLAVKSDGTVVAWGMNYYGQCNVPAPNVGFVAVAAGQYHSLGLKSDRTIVAWGENGVGQCNVPAPNADFIAVASGWWHSLGVKSDGTIVAWGQDDIGQCDVPAPNAGFIGVAAGGAYSAGFSVGLKSDGTIVAWGSNAAGQCDVPEPNTGFMAVAAGGAHSLGLKTDGTIVAWGRNQEGQCGIPEPNAGFLAVAAGEYHSLGLKSDGTIVVWGSCVLGQCDVPAPNANFSAIAAGHTHSLGVKSDGTLVAWGRNEAGECNVPAPNGDFVAVAGGKQHDLGLKSDGMAVAWGYNSYGQCDIPDPNAVFTSLAVGNDHSLGVKSDRTIVAWGDNRFGQCNVPAPNADFLGAAAGYRHSLGVRSDGTISAWGDNTYGQCNVPAPNADFIAAAAGLRHSLGLKSDGTISAWGNNTYGQCNVPAPNANFTAVAAGDLHSLGLKNDGTIVAWGYNAYGQCNVPAPNSGFAAVAGGEYHSLGQKSDGTLVAWGSNAHGQCDVPVSTQEFMAISAAGSASMAITRAPIAACCLLTGECYVIAELACESMDGLWHSDWAGCDPNPCYVPVDSIAVTAGEWSNAEPWHDWISDVGGAVPIHAFVPEYLGTVDHVEFYYSTDGGATWHFIADDTDGYEPPMNTVDHSVLMSGCGWSTSFDIPDSVAAGPIQFKSVAYPDSGVAFENVNEYVYDPAPPSMGTANLQDFTTIDRDGLGIEINSNGAEIERIVVNLGPMDEIFTKGIPGINQLEHDSTYCAPTAAAQCLRYFIGQGDAEVGGGLDEFRLVEALGAYMGTDQDVVGTLPSSWVGGLGEWIEDYGAGYTVRYYVHYSCDVGGSTWTEEDWRRIRNELERCRDVLVGVWWDAGGAHALTMDSIIYPELPDGSIAIEFKDPWTGSTETAQLDRNTGHLANVTGSGGGGGGRIGVTMLVSPVEEALNAGGPGDPVYDGLPAEGPPYHIDVTIPNEGLWFVHITLVNSEGHTSRITNIIEYDSQASADQQEQIPLAFQLRGCLPNPFQRSTEIAYAVPRTARVELTILDVSGRLVKTLVAGDVAAGIHRISWDGTDREGRRVGSGIYFMRMNAPGYESAKKIVAVR